jgi:hypothetical protein
LPDSVLKSTERVSVAESNFDARRMLTDVNREFGVAAEIAAVVESPVENPALPTWWTSNFNNAPSGEEPVCETDFPSTLLEKSRCEATSITESTGSPQHPSPSDNNSVDDLRSKLASMFDLDLAANPNIGEGFGQESPSASEPFSAEVAAEREMIVEQASLHSDRQVGRARDLTAELVNVRQQAPLIEESPASSRVRATSNEADSRDEEDDSVEAFMARLLARSRGEPESSPPGDVSQKSVATNAATVRTESVNAEPQPVQDDLSKSPSDRSHLTAEPKHKQDKDVVRENLQSFRQVAQLSARAALARHSSIQLRNAVIAKGVLFGGSALAAISFFSAPLFGMRPKIWYGVACCLVSLLAAWEFLRSRKQLLQSIQITSPDQRPDASVTAADDEANPKEANSNVGNPSLESTDQLEAEARNPTSGG